MYPKSWGKKLGSHCRNVVVSDVKLVNRMYSDRCFHNSSFVDYKLLQPTYVSSMLSVCKYVKPNVSFADVLKREQKVLSGRKPQDLVKVGWEAKNINSKNCTQVGNVSVNMSVNKCENVMMQDQGCEYRHGRTITGNKRAVNQNRPVCDNVKNQFIYVNRFQPLLNHIESSINRNCQSVVENNIMKKTGSAGQNVSVYLKDGKETRGKRVSKVCNVAVPVGEDLGTAKTAVKNWRWKTYSYG